MSTSVPDDVLQQNMLQYMAASPDAAFKTLWPEIKKEPALKNVSMGKGLKTFLFLSQEAEESGLSFAALLERYMCASTRNDAPPPPTGAGYNMASPMYKVASESLSEDAVRHRFLELMAASPELGFKDLWPKVQNDLVIGGHVDMGEGLRIFLALSQEAEESGSTVQSMLEKMTCVSNEEESCAPPPPSNKDMEVVVDPSNYVGCNSPECDDQDCVRTDLVPGGGEATFQVRVDKCLKVSAEEKPGMIVSDATKTMRALVTSDHCGYSALRDRVGTSNRTTLGFKAYFRARLGDDGMVYVNIARPCRGEF